MASMSGLVFLLLIFFIITSTLVAPNAIKLLLPGAGNKTVAQQSVTVYINQNEDIFVDGIIAAKENLEAQLQLKLTDESEGTVVLRAEKSVPVEQIVAVIDAVNAINLRQGSKHKVILAAVPK
jgi:biopolymer transport protein ExbD